MKKKGTIAALALILAAGLGLYFAWMNKDIEKIAPPVTKGTVSPEYWATKTPATSAAPNTDKPVITTAATVKATNATTSTRGSAAVTQPPAIAAPNSRYAYAGLYEGINPAVTTFSASNPYLFVVSRKFALPAGYVPALAVCVPAYPEKREMEKTAAAQYKKMYDAAKKDGAELIPYSGYRSISHQKNNFDNKINFYITQGYSHAQAVNLAAQSINPPGCSEHEAGLAMDITRPGVWNTADSFKDTKEYAWLMAHAQDYGFILRYPADKTEITGVKFEPWHWRYVGIETAKEIKASGKCLEEYLNLA
jgi:D-alanyl-D-alanine carboxypeptidase